MPHFDELASKYKHYHYNECNARGTGISGRAGLDDVMHINYFSYSSKAAEKIESGELKKRYGYNAIDNDENEDKNDE